MNIRLSFISLAISCLPQALGRGILAIDYGAQYMQISLVQPGLSFDVLLNHDSKRKTQSSVSIKNDDKAVGDSAASLATRYPQNSFSAVKLLLGQPINSPAAEFHRKLYNIPLNTTHRNTILFSPNSPSSHTNTTKITYLPEELLALQFSYARELADQASLSNPSATGGEKIVDAIITVPGFFNQFERRALLDAAELSGLKVLTLIDDGSSVAVNYAMMRSFLGQKEMHIIYDVGASSIKSTVVEFEMFEEKIHPASKTLKNVTRISAKGYGFERNFGGFNFDDKIRDKLVKDFEEKEKVRVRENDRAMIKLLKEAAKVKHILSANNESQCRVEGLIDDKDFKSSITRQEFEAMFLVDQQSFTKPILDSLANAKLTLEDIKSVILVGGSTRVPMIQTALKALVGEDKIAVNVNADEAAVMGAALYGAGVSRQFKTKDIRIHPISPHTISASYNVHSEVNKGTTTTTNTVFGEKSKLGSKKTLKLKSNTDISILFAYGNQPHYFPSEVLNATIHGISTALLNHTNVTGIAIPAKNSTISVSVKLDDFGFLNVLDASLLIPGGSVATSSSGGRLAEKIAGFFGGSSKGGKEGEDEEEQETVTTPTTDAEEKEKNEKKPEKGEKSGIEKAQKTLKAENEGGEKAGLQQPVVVEDVVVKLQISRQALGILPMTTHDRITSGKMIRDLKAAETRKKSKEEARNALEAYTYKLRDRLDQDGGNGLLAQFSTQGEIDELKSAREATSDWLNDWGEEAPIKELKGRKNELELKEKKILDRVAEFEKRPEAFKSFEQTLEAAKTLTTLISTQIASGGDKNPLEYTIEDIGGLSKMINEQTAWFNDIRAKQHALEKNRDVIVKVSEIEARKKVIDEEAKRLTAKKAPKKQKGYTTKPVKSDEKKDEKAGKGKVEEELKLDHQEDTKKGVKDEL